MQIVRKFISHSESIFRGAQSYATIPVSTKTAPKNVDTILRCQMNGQLYDESIWRVTEGKGAAIIEVEYVEKVFTPGALELFGENWSFVSDIQIYGFQNYNGLAIPLMRYRLISDNYFFEGAWQLVRGRDAYVFKVNLFDEKNHEVERATWNT